ncbi:MAG: sigma 54-interacting transcriptional regulator, partial [Kofleriaceae bacterium]
ELEPTPRGVVLRDLGSKNGTRVNGSQVEGALLRAACTLGIGTTRLSIDEELDPAGARFGALLGESGVMRALFAKAMRIAASDATVLIDGETGTGKGVLAQAIHDASPRRSGPFLVLDCGAIPATLIESELFGHEKGAFTGADRARPGLFEAARGGTVFLDEIGELPATLQPRLLRALEERAVRRIGATHPTRLDVRIIAATHKNLRLAVKNNELRADLFYRLTSVHLRMPSLRGRPDDIPLLATAFHRSLTGEDPDPALLAALAARSFDGNVRELKSAIEQVVLLGDVQSDAPPPAAALATGEPISTPFRVAKQSVVESWEREYLRRLLAHVDGNVSAAARTARMDRNHLRTLLDRYDLAP